MMLFRRRVAIIVLLHAGSYYMAKCLAAFAKSFIAERDDDFMMTAEAQLDLRLTLRSIREIDDCRKILCIEVCQKAASSRRSQCL